MSPAMQALLQQQDQIAKESLQRLKQKAPEAYQAVIEDLNAKRGGHLSGLGQEDSGTSWGDLGMELLDSYMMVETNERVQEEDRKALELELQKLQEQNKSVERQLELQNEIEKTKAEAEKAKYAMTMQSRAEMAGESVLDQLQEKPWAIPALLGLGFMLWRSRRKG